MKRNDWIGLVTSLVLHGLLIFLFTFLTAASPEPEPLGFIEVELGPFAEGRPVQQAVETRPQVEEVEPERPQPQQPKPAATPPKEAKPVKLPEQPVEVPEEEKVQASKAETVSPVTKNNPAEVKKTEPEPESKPVKPLGSGAREGTAGAPDGEAGKGNDEAKSAPYQIEGLNRSAVFTVLPSYTEKVNAVIRVRITVDPQGRIVQRIPLLKGNPALEQAVMTALERWRFNPLPPNVPRENQTGVVTFRFQLE